MTVMALCLAPGEKKQHLTFWAQAESSSHQVFPISATGFLFSLQEAMGCRQGFGQG